MARGRREDLLPGRHEVRLVAAVAGGPLGGEVGDAVDVRHVAVRRADGDRAVGVAGIVDRETEARRGGAAIARVHVAVAGVAGGHDDHHARAHELVHLDADRALSAREPLGLEVVADADVDAVDARRRPWPFSSPTYCSAEMMLLATPLPSSLRTLRLSSLQRGAIPAMRGSGSSWCVISPSLSRIARDAVDRLRLRPLLLAGDDARDVRPVAEVVLQRPLRSRPETVKSRCRSDESSRMFSCLPKCGWSPWMPESTTAQTISSPTAEKAALAASAFTVRQDRFTAARSRSRARCGRSGVRPPRCDRRRRGSRRARAPRTRTGWSRSWPRRRPDPPCPCHASRSPA